MQWGFIAGGAAVLVLIVPWLVMLLTPRFHGTEYTEPKIPNDFELPRADGGTLSLSGYKGQVVVLYFGYTSCQDVCPATLYALNQAILKLGDRAKGVTVMFVTVDPAVDDPTRLRQYLAAFNPDFIGLYGTSDQLQPVYDEFRVSVLRADRGQTSSRQDVTHTTSLMVLDRLLRLRLQLHEGETVNNITEDLQRLLTEDLN
jgi:protein SCO1/2